ncbi:MULTISPECIES: phage major tail tube protein [Photobacterium]|uniref:Phage tail protein n=1 Tax=Photobacterium alginatilyticum TaxID=1775171 RepID=A0ABW9YLH1_9GAMM|nr:MULTISPECIES: phage major tail tube protein [Photobacterium]MCG7588424.1 phage major tail tube protein [Photobacterium sp. OFAV2-7]NBI54643.1 phage tail protein [Photobacterium alginatilyticum]
MAADNILKRWSIWVDGIGKAGNAKEYTPPALEVITKDFQAGDMDMPIPIDVGMAGMETSYSIYGVDVTVLPLFGLRQGSRTAVSVRSTYQDLKGNSYDLVEELGGMITKIERDTQDGGDQSDKAMKVTQKLDYYKVVRSGVELIEIDPVNHVRKLGGIDALEGIRALMQLS